MSDPIAQQALNRWWCCGHLDRCMADDPHDCPGVRPEGRSVVDRLPELADAVAAAVREQLTREVAAMVAPAVFLPLGDVLAVIRGDHE